MEPAEFEFEVPADVPQVTTVDLPDIVLHSLPRIRMFKIAYGHMWEWVHRCQYLKTLIIYLRRTTDDDFLALSRREQARERGLIMGMVTRFVMSMTNVQSNTSITRVRDLLQLKKIDEVRVRRHRYSEHVMKKINVLESFLHGTFSLFNTIAGDCVHRGFIYEYFQCYHSAVFVFNNFVALLNQQPIPVIPTETSLALDIIARRHDVMSTSPTWGRNVMKFSSVFIAFRGGQSTPLKVFDHALFGTKLMTVLTAYHLLFPHGILINADEQAIREEQMLILWIQQASSERNATMNLRQSMHEARRSIEQAHDLVQTNAAAGSAREIQASTEFVQGAASSEVFNQVMEGILEPVPRDYYPVGEAIPAIPSEANDAYDDAPLTPVRIQPADVPDEAAAEPAVEAEAEIEYNPPPTDDYGDEYPDVYDVFFS